MSLKLKDLTCEYRTNPLGLAVKKPRFSWKLVSDNQNVMQTAYKIVVATDQDYTDIVWDSGKVTDDTSVLLTYAGNSLQSCTRYYYSVTVWDNQGETAKESAWFETAFMDRNEWKAKFITAVEQTEEVKAFCQEIKLKEPVKQARLYCTALGVYELFIDDQRVGRDVLSPGCTSYNKRLLYQTYDITQLLKEKSVLKAVVGNGWFKGFRNDHLDAFDGTRSFLGQIEIVYESGQTETIITDENWKLADTPILMSELYDGETYDARLEKVLTSEELEFLPNVQILQRDYSTLFAQDSVMISEREQLPAKEIIHAPNGETIVDFGQNFAGYVEVTVNGNAGDRVVYDFGEILDKDGNFYNANYRRAANLITYTLKGEGEETYHPHLTFQAGQYIRIKEFPGQPQLCNFKAIAVYSDMEMTGKFECSDALLNQLQSNIQWGQKDNFLDVPTDCPQRNERLGWTGDAQVFIRTACFNMNVATFFSKWLVDLCLDYTEEWGVPQVCPDVVGEGAIPGWADAQVICPWTIYQCYGDKRILEQNYDTMKKWIEYMYSHGENPYLYNRNPGSYGDWLSLDTPDGTYCGCTPEDYIGAAFYAYSTELFYKTAQVLGKTKDAKYYQKLHAKIKREFNKHYVTPIGRCSAHTQTGQVLPLAFGLLDKKAQAYAMKMLVAIIKRLNNHLHTGFLGTPFLCHVLTKYGRADLAYALLMQKDYPSWLYPVTKGATTIWEHWDGKKPDGSLWSANMNSFNHYAYGAIGDWMYRAICGIELDEQKPGYKHILLQPVVGEPLDWAQATYESVYGTIISRWEKVGSDVKYTFTIPANTNATITLNGQVFERGSGTYEFIMPYQKIVAE